jgi:hypothetical protein
MTATATAMNASMVIGLLVVVVVVMFQGCRRHWLPSIGISPVRTLMCVPGHQGQPRPKRIGPGNAANPARSAESLPDRGRVLCRRPWPG